jgi:riboflavin kinase/FMN adenylyltransferase
MLIWNQTTPDSLTAFRGSVVTIGNFDGLHLGHQALLKRALGLPGRRVVITFDPHPLQVLYPERELKRLLPREDISEQLPKYGVDLLWIIPFTRRFAQLSGREFLETCVGAPFDPRHMIAGYDFGFGKDRTGTLESLQEWATAHECALHVVPPLNVEGRPVSSRRLRELIQNGDVAAAARLMGRPFYLRGEVIHGAGRGASIGVPTMNQQVINETLPKQGVYITSTRVGGEERPSVTNIGWNPTFGGSAAVKVETHVVDGRPCEARGQSIDVSFLERLRDEKKFSSVDELKAQIHRDIEEARCLHGCKQPS